MPLIRKIYERILWNHIKNGDKPNHVGIILDGNRRWASTHGFPSSLGHNFGAQKVEDLLNWCMDLNIHILTIYVFSTENFDRQSCEVNAIMNLLRVKLKEALNDKRIDDNKINIKALGRTHLLPEDVLELVRKVERKTEFYDRFFLNIAVAYGGRAEIVDATRKIADLAIEYEKPIGLGITGPGMTRLQAQDRIDRAKAAVEAVVKLYKRLK